MKCPICHIDLQVADRQGVEIDYCPQCRGVWLDRGELDKIIERGAQFERERGQVRGPEFVRDPEPATPPVTPPYPPQTQTPPAPYPPQYPQNAPYPPQQPYPPQAPPGYDPRYDQDQSGRKRKRGGFLGDIFDFS